MGKAVQVAWPEYEAPAQLKRVPAQSVLRLAGCFGPRAGAKVVFPQKVHEIRRRQLQSLIGFTRFVHQQGKGDAGLFTEGPGISAVAKANGGQSGSTFAKCRFATAQLRDVLAAEDSTVVPQEHDDGGLAQPE